jgi:hypothetical protein
MSQTVAAAIRNIRNFAEDKNASRYIVSNERMLALLQARYQALLDAMTLGVNKEAAKVTLVAGTREYSLGGASPSYTGILSVVDDETLVPLERVTLEAMHGLIETAQQGRPTQFALYENSDDNALMIVLDPVPTANEAADTLTVWDNVAGGALTTATTLFLADGLMRALEKGVAADALASMSPEDMKSRGVTQQTLERYEGQYESGVREGRARLMNHRRQSRVTLVTR